MKKSMFLAGMLLAAAMTAAPLTCFAEEAAPASEETEPTAPPVQYKYGLDAEGNAELYDFLESETFAGELTIPAEIEGHHVDYVGNACFLNAKGITAVTVPASITDMGDSVFMGCTSITEFRVEPGNPYYSIKDGVLMADDGAFLVAYPAGKADAEYTVPAGVNEIAPGAFSYSYQLKTVNIPEGVEFIDNLAFAYSGIQKANVAGSVYQIDDYAFSYCEGLHEVNLGKGIEKIYNAAFAYDKALTQITLPDTLTSIGQYAFCGTSLACVTIPDSLEKIDFCAFGYDASMNAIADFTIYGEPNTMAQEYSTASDPENDYENHFNFVAVQDASIPYELGGGKLYGEDAGSETTLATNENGETLPTSAATEAVTAESANLTDEIGVGLFGNKKAQMMLAIGGGVLVLLAVILIVVFAVKPKKKTPGEKTEETDDAE